MIFKNNVLQSSNEGMFNIIDDIIAAVDNDAFDAYAMLHTPELTEIQWYVVFFCLRHHYAINVNKCKTQFNGHKPMKVVIEYKPWQPHLQAAGRMSLYLEAMAESKKMVDDVYAAL